ncbi:hypothetical protein Tco_1492724 [Tanacetum coccineum]
MSLEESDDLVILDAEPAGPALEVGIPANLHPRVVPEGMTMNALSNDAIGLYAHHFQQGGLRVPFSSFFLKVVEHFCVHISQLVPLSINRVTFFELYCRALDIVPTVPLFASFTNYANKDKFFLVDRRAAPIAMAWRHHDSSVADPFPKSNEYDASDVATLRETGDIAIAEIPCRKILEDKEKKRRKVEEKAAANAPATNIQVKTIVDKDASKEGPRKKRMVRVRPQVQPNLEHVSSPTPLNHAKPLETLANEEHVSPPLSVGRMDTLRDQTDENGKVDVAAAMEGHGDNEGGLSGLQTQPSPAHRSSRHPDTVKRHARDNIVPEVEASYSAGRFGNLPSTPQWGLTNSSRMDNSPEWTILANAKT